MDQKKFEVIQKLQHGDAIYAIMSGYTNMPYVECDKETFDDKVFVFFDEERAKEAGAKLMKERNLVQIAKVENEMLMNFYMSLFPIGVNCVHVECGFEDDMMIQREEIVRREEAKGSDDGVRIENQELQLTALYFSQEFRKHPVAEVPDELEELYDEMLAHFQRGKLIIPAHEENGVPILRQQEGHGFLPLFTDIQEFHKFDRSGTFKAGIVEAANVPALMTDEMEGVVVNPFGVNLILAVGKNQPAPVLDEEE